MTMPLLHSRPQRDKTPSAACGLTDRANPQAAFFEQMQQHLQIRECDFTDFARPENFINNESVFRRKVPTLLLQFASVELIWKELR
jgi:hypothetical protein